MKPTVGRIVHYTNLGDRDGKYPPEIQAAIVTKVTAKPGTMLSDSSKESIYSISLHIFYPTGQFDLQDVPFTEHAAGSDDARGKWAWPARD